MTRPDLPLLALFSVPPLKLAIGILATASVAGFVVGLVRIRRTDGKILVVLSGLVLLALAAALAAVLFTVWSGSMG
jgi:predicted signal transduction protein with EAL and GGDEF domain